MLSRLDHEPTARAKGLEALAERLVPGWLDEHASALIAKGDKNLLLNLGRLQLLVEPCDETYLKTALALLERGCVYDDSPTQELLGYLSCDCEEHEEHEERRKWRRTLSAHLVRMLDLLCSDEVSWPAGRCQLGRLVAWADPRYKGLRWTDARCLQECDDWTELPVAPSMEMWRQARAVLSGMPAGMPAEEQVKRMGLAIFSPKKDIDVLTTFNEYRQGTIASMVSELADGIGAVALSDKLVRGTFFGLLGPDKKRGVGAGTGPNTPIGPMPAPTVPAPAVAAPAASAGSSGTVAPQPPQSGMDPTAAAFSRMYAAPPPHVHPVCSAPHSA